MTNSKIDKKELSSLYNGCDIADIWQASLNLKVIVHPNLGKITPNVIVPRQINPIGWSQNQAMGEERLDAGE